MIDTRIYRAAFIPALLAVVVAMFSLEGRPPPLTADLAPDAFDSERAATLTRSIAELTPRRAPGERDSEPAAAFVAERLATIRSGELVMQRFRAPFRGRSVQMRNVVLTLPGDSDRRVVVMAHRDSAEPPGAATSAAATGTLLELAANAGAARHRKTLVFVSTDGATAGAAGARRFATHFPGRDKVEAAIVIDQPAVGEAERPFLVPWSAGPQSTSIQLVQSAKSAIRQEVGRNPGVAGWVGWFMRLALPVAVGEQGVLIGHGIDAVTLSSKGELPQRPARDGVESISTVRLDQFGRAALTLIQAVDERAQPLVHGPRAYVAFAGNLLPGWALALLGLALLVPVGLSAADGLARSRRHGERVGLWFRHLAACALPFVAVLASIYALWLVGLIPDPAYPYDPRRYPLDGAAAAALAVLAVVFALGLLAVRPLALPARLAGSLAHGAPAALGLLLFGTVLGVWAFNPYGALLLLPAAHLWTFAVVPEFELRRWQTVAAIAAGLAAPALAFAYMADRLEVGGALIWQIPLLVSGGHIGLPLALLACVLGGCLVGVAALVRLSPGGRSRSAGTEARLNMPSSPLTPVQRHR